MGGASAIAVLGVGNILLSDDGFGVRALEKFKEMYHDPEGVTLIDGGTGGLSLATVLEGKSLVIILDALEMKGVEVDMVVKLEANRIKDVLEGGGHVRSLHDIGMAEVLAIAAFESEPPDVIIIGMSPRSLEPGLELTPQIESRLSVAADMTAVALRDAGIIVKRRDNECCA